MMGPRLRFKKTDGSSYPDWEEKKLEEISEIKDSARIPNCKWKKAGVPYYRAKDFNGKKLSGELYISYEDYELYKSKTGAPEKGDLLFVSGGNIGLCVLKKDDFPIYVQGGAVLYVRTSASSHLSGGYLEQYFESPFFKAYIGKTSVGGTITHFTLKPASKAPILLPCLEEQHKIASFLSDLDEVISKSDAEVAALEKQKKGVMQKIFSQEVRFKRNDGSEYPDWEETIVGEHADFYNGDRGKNYPSAADYIKDGVPFINAGDLDGLAVSKKCVKISIEKYNSLGGVKLQPNDILYCLRGSLGKIGIVTFETGGTVASSLVAIRAKDVYYKYLYYFLSSDLEYKQRIINNEGAAQPNLSAKNVQNFIMPFPCLEEQQKIADFLSDFDTAINLAKQELEKWKLLKKGLMQQMFV